MENGDEKEQVENGCDGKKFRFTYDGIADINLNPGHDIKEFQ